MLPNHLRMITYKLPICEHNVMPILPRFIPCGYAI